MNRHIITVILLLAAITLYVIGAVLAATGILILGALLECAFWLRLFTSGNSRQ